MAQQQQFSLKGSLLAGCNCGWGCPCSFEEPPTYAFCEGMYVWHVATGQYAGTALDGCTFAMYNLFPGAVHEGNATTLVMVDETLPADRRPAIESMIKEKEPFSVFLDLTSTFHGFRYLPFDLRLDGIRSSLTIPGIFELHLGPMKNPVTGKDELATLTKPTGFTSKIQELCSADNHSFSIEGMSYDHSGKYGEFAPFEYPI
jgi:hypothetical protein